MKIKKIFSVLLCALLLISALPMTALAEEATASTMRLEKCEGTVTVKNASGKTLKITEKMRLYNGYEITTSAKSYAYISLDGTKAVKLDASTKVSVTKAGKKLEILVSSGKLLFDVSAPLDDDESLEIRTSTSLTGVRGTVGYVTVTSPTESVLTILEGVTEVTTVNPTTGETSVTRVTSGQQLSSLMTPEESGETITVVVTDIAPEDIPGFVLTYVAENPEVQERIEENSELEIQVVVANAEEILKLEEDESEKQEQEIQQQLGQLETEAVDPLFEEEKNSQIEPDDTGSDVPSPSPTTCTVTFDMNGIGTAPAPMTVNPGVTITQPAAPTADGYSFGGWFKDADCTTAWSFETDTVSGDTTLFAKWIPLTFTVTFDTNGIGTAPTPMTVNPGAAITQPAAPTAAGYSFGGWFKDADCSTAWSFETDTVSGDTTLFAKWITTAATLDNPTTAQVIEALQQAAASTEINTVSVTNAALTVSGTGVDENGNPLPTLLSIPSGETLEINSGSLAVEQGGQITVSGTMTMAAGTTFDNSGQTDILSTNSLHISGQFINKGTINVGVVHEDLTATPGLLEIVSGGTMINSGQITLGSGDLVNSGGVTNSGTIAINGNVGGQFINNPNAKFENNGEFGNTMLTDIGRLIFWNTVAAGTFVNEGEYIDKNTDLRAIVTTGSTVSYVGPVANLTTWPDNSTVQLIGGTEGALPSNSNYNNIPAFLVEGVVTLDLNGRTIKTDSIYLQIGGYKLIDETTGETASVAGVLTVTDTSSTGSGKITSANTSCTVYCSDTLLLAGGTIENTAETGEYSPAIYGGGEPFNITIQGGTVSSKQHAISNKNQSGTYGNITITGGTVSGGTCAVFNSSNSYPLLITGGTLTSAQTVISAGSDNTLIRNATLCLTAAAPSEGDIQFAVTSGTCIFENCTVKVKNTDFFAPLGVTDWTGPDEGYYTATVTYDPTTTVLVDPDFTTLNDTIRLAADIGIKNIIVTESSLTLSEELAIPSGVSVILRSGGITVNAGGMIYVDGTLTIEEAAGLFNYGSVNIGSSDAPYGTMNCSGEFYNEGTYLNYSYSYQKLSYVKVSSADGRDVYVGAADGTNWCLEFADANSFVAEFYIYSDNSNANPMIIPNSIDNINMEFVNCTPGTTAHITTQTGSLTVTKGSLNLIPLSADTTDYSTPCFAYTGSIEVINSTLSAQRTGFTGHDSVCLLNAITVETSETTSRLHLIACELNQDGSVYAIMLQNSSLYLGGLHVEDATGATTGITYRSKLTCSGDGIYADSTSDVRITALDLTAGGVGLDLRCDTFLTDEGNYVNNSTIIADGSAVRIETLENPVSFFNCEITSTAGSAIENLGRIELESCNVAGAVYALYNEGFFLSRNGETKFTLTAAAPIDGTPTTTFVVYNGETGEAELYGIFVAKSSEQLFYNVKLSEELTPTEMPDGWFVCTIPFPE